MTTNIDLYDKGTLHMAQAKALIECIAIAAKDGDDGIPYEDAASGVIALLDSASDAFRSIRFPREG